ncbi:competence protein ComK [Bacillus sp. 1P06AnD]|uniref:competence protein ComK n=1 Tax=Bacillus sp. 1P06AnD TaxID=3132208 RepID=UPI0039A2C878
MKKVPDYKLIFDSVLMYTRYDSNGEHYATVIETDGVIHVNQKPIDIMKESILYYGSDLSGAIKGAKHLLGDIRIPPLKVSGFHRMYWLCTEKLTSGSCIFMACHHIDQVIGKPRKKPVTVIFKNGYSIRVELTLDQFNAKRGKTNDLQFYTEKRLRNKQEKAFSDYLIIKDPDTGRYAIKKEQQSEDFEEE